MGKLDFSTVPSEYFSKALGAVQPGDTAVINGNEYDYDQIKSVPEDRYEVAFGLKQDKKPNPLMQEMEDTKSRMQNRAALIDKPTALGTKATSRFGNPYGIVEGIAGTPERLGRLGLGALGSAADLAMYPINAGLRTANEATGGKLGDVGKFVMEKAISLPGIKEIPKKYEGFRSSLSEGDQANLDASVGGLGGLLQFGGLGKAQKTLSNVGKVTEQQVNKSAEMAARKGLKFVKSGNISPVKNIENNQRAVKVIAKYKDETGVKTPVDEAEGTFISETRKAPKTAEENLDAIVKTKQVIYKKYNDMAKQAGDKSALFDDTQSVKLLEDAANDLGYTPEARAHAAKEIQAISELRGQLPEIIERRIAALNTSLKPFYQNTDRVGIEKAKIDMAVAAEMRKQLDEKITNAVGEGYQQLKNEYGALKSVENAYMHRARLQMNKAPAGYFDITDIVSTPEIIIGIMTGNLAQAARGGGMKGVKEFIKWKNNPDRYIKNSFEKAWKYEDQLPQVDKTISYGEIPNLPSPPLPELDRFGKFYPSVSLKKDLPKNPKLDQDLQINKIISELKSKRSPQEVDDLIKSLTTWSLPVKQPYILPEDLMTKLRGFKNRRIMEDLQ